MHRVVMPSLRRVVVDRTCVNRLLVDDEERKAIGIGLLRVMELTEDGTFALVLLLRIVVECLLCLLTLCVRVIVATLLVLLHCLIVGGLWWPTRWKTISAYQIMTGLSEVESDTDTLTRWPVDHHESIAIAEEVPMDADGQS